MHGIHLVASHFLLRAEKPMNDCLWQNSFHFLSIRISFDGFMVSRNGWQWFDCWNRRQTGRLGSFVSSDSDDSSDGQTIGFAFLRGSNKRPPECQWISRNDRNVKSPYWNLKCTACDVTKRSKRFLTAFDNFFPWHFARLVFVFLEDCEPFRGEHLKALHVCALNANMDWLLCRTINPDIHLVASSSLSPVFALDGQSACECIPLALSPFGFYACFMISSVVASRLKVCGRTWNGRQ